MIICSYRSKRISSNLFIQILLRLPTILHSPAAAKAATAEATETSSAKAAATAAKPPPPQ